MLGVRLPSELDRRLSALAHTTKRSKSFYVKEALLQYLDEYEDIYQAIEDYEREKKAGTLKTYTLAEVMKRNGLTQDDLDTADIESL